MGSDLATPGSGLLCLPDRYEEEAHKHATAENDFVVLKKVRGGQGLPWDPEHPPCTKQSPGLGQQGEWEILTQHVIVHCLRGAPGGWDTGVDTGAPEDLMEGPCDELWVSLWEKVGREWRTQDRWGVLGEGLLKAVCARVREKGEQGERGLEGEGMGPRGGRG